MRLGLTDENLLMLEDRTEGWIASLQMAAISMQGRTDIPGFIKAFSGNQRHLLDYLWEEVLCRQPADVQSFLLATSILDRLTAPLCNAVTEHKDAQQKLDYLEAVNLFIVPLDCESTWVRYHHLFADLLRNKLARSQSELPILLHHRASEWFEQEGLMAEAIDHALSTEDFERAEDRVKEYFGTTSLGMKKSLNIWMEDFIDMVLAREERKSSILRFPPYHRFVWP